MFLFFLACLRLCLLMFALALLVKTRLNILNKNNVIAFLNSNNNNTNTNNRNDLSPAFFRV
jgi:hypothetical protein